MKNYCFAIFCILLAANAFAQKASLVKDIYTGDEGSELVEFVQIDSNAYFVTNTLGKILWKFDYTTNNTKAIHNAVSDLKVIDKSVYFSSSFKSVDGTPTRYFHYRYNTINDKLDSIARNNTNSTFIVNQQLCYLTNTSIGKLDFTDQKDELIKTFSLRIYSYNSISTATELYFFVERQLWKSDGTINGTVLLKQFSANNDSQFNSLFAWKNNVYFVGNNPSTGQELWKSDGTEVGTVLVKDITYQFTDIRKGKGGADVENYNLCGNKIIFMADNGATGLEPWITDGTIANTKLVKNINLGRIDNYRRRINPLVKLNNRACFFANDSENGTELWASDGTSQGTSIIKNFSSNSASTKFDDYKDNFFDNKLYLNIKTDSLNYALWETDGTTAGTKLLVPNEIEDLFRQPTFKKNNMLYYVAYDSYRKTNPNINKINLNEANPIPKVVFSLPKDEEFLTQLVSKRYNIFYTRSYPNGSNYGVIKINILDNSDSIKIITLGQINISEAFVSDENISLFFYSYTTKRYEYYCYNITTKKSFTIKNLNYQQAIQYDNRILFFAYNGTSSQLSINEIDFENESYYRITDIKNTRFETYLGYIKNKLVYTTSNNSSSSSSEEMHTFDLATLKEQNLGINWKNGIGYYPKSIILTKNFIYFYALDTLGNTQIFQTGGTKENTQALPMTSLLIRNDNPIEIDNNIYFIAADGIHGYELWKYDFKPTDVSEPNQEENSVQLFPNPSSTEVQIKATKQWQSVSIFDALGRKYYHNNLTTNELRIPTSNLPNGIYLMEIIFSNQKRTCKKFVLQK